MLSGLSEWLPLAVLVVLIFVASRTLPPPWVGLACAVIFGGYWLVAGPRSNGYTVLGVVGITALVAQSTLMVYRQRRDRRAAAAPDSGEAGA
ncbi:hypothetical protein [Nocardia asteroides]